MSTGRGRPELPPPASSARAAVHVRRGAEALSRRRQGIHRLSLVTRMPAPEDTPSWPRPTGVCARRRGPAAADPRTLGTESGRREGMDDAAIRLRFERRLPQIDELMEMYARDRGPLEATPLYELKVQVDAAAARGRDLMADMVARFEAGHHGRHQPPRRDALHAVAAPGRRAQAGSGRCGHTGA